MQRGHDLVSQVGVWAQGPSLSVSALSHHSEGGSGSLAEGLGSRSISVFVQGCAESLAACTCLDTPSLPLFLLGPLSWVRGPHVLTAAFLCPLTGLIEAPCLLRPLLHLVLYSSLKPGNPDKVGREEGAHGHTTVAPPSPAWAGPAQGRTWGPVPVEWQVVWDPLVGDVTAEALCPQSSVCGCVCTHVLTTLHACMFVSTCMPVGECTHLCIYEGIVPLSEGYLISLQVCNASHLCVWDLTSHR